MSTYPVVKAWSNLERVAALLADGALRIPIQQTYELAHSALTGEHTHGELAVSIA